MVSIRSINFTCRVVSISPIYMMIVNLNHYGCKWMVLVYTSIVCPRRNIYPGLNGSIGMPKERVQSVQTAIISRRIYKLMIINLVTTAIFWINDFPLS